MLLNRSVSQTPLSVVFFNSSRNKDAHRSSSLRFEEYLWSWLGPEHCAPCCWKTEHEWILRIRLVDWKSMWSQMSEYSLKSYGNVIISKSWSSYSFGISNKLFRYSINSNKLHFFAFSYKLAKVEFPPPYYATLWFQSLISSLR